MASGEWSSGLSGLLSPEMSSLASPDLRPQRALQPLSNHNSQEQHDNATPNIKVTYSRKVSPSEVVSPHSEMGRKDDTPVERKPAVIDWAELQRETDRLASYPTRGTAYLLASTVCVAAGAAWLFWPEEVVNMPTPAAAPSMLMIAPPTPSLGAVSRVRELLDEWTF